jgi:hypothetical protein
MIDTDTPGIASMQISHFDDYYWLMILINFFIVGHPTVPQHRPDNRGTVWGIYDLVSKRLQSLFEGIKHRSAV